MENLLNKIENLLNQIAISDYEEAGDHKLKNNKALIELEETYNTYRHKAKKVTTEEQTTFIPESIEVLQEKGIEVNIDDYLGDANRNISIKGNAEDAVKIINAINNIGYKKMQTVDTDDLIRYIRNRVDVYRDDIERVLELELEYLKLQGLVE